MLKLPLWRKCLCGEGIYPRWVAQPPQTSHPRSFKEIAFEGFTTATQPDGDKSPRHKGTLTKKAT